METFKAVKHYKDGYLLRLKQRFLWQTMRSFGYYLKKLQYNLSTVKYAKHPGAMQLPKWLQAPKYVYAGYAGPWFEEYFMQVYAKSAGRPETQPVYLPVLFDNFYLQSQSGAMLPADFERTFAMHMELYEQLGKSANTYFTVLGIYDFPIWNWHLFPKNCVVFAGNGGGDIPIPLLKGDLPFSMPPKNIRVSFMGKLDGASDKNGVRSKMYEALKDFAHFGQGPEWYEVMKASVFTLCPRGLGRASFRLYEALSVGSIPIYIWDDRPWLPYQEELDWNKFAISVHVDELHKIPEIIGALSDSQIAQMQQYIAAIYSEYFTYEATAQYIFRKLAALDSPEKITALTHQR